MKDELKEKVAEENKYYELLNSNPQYRLQGYSKLLNKVIVGIIKGNPENYNRVTDQLDFKHFDSWKDAYKQLTK